MVLIIGGEASGKAAYAKSLGFAEKDVLLNLHELVFSGNKIDEASLYAKAVITCNEVGSGIIPLDPVERKRREECGRLCCRLAERADKVIRIVCGIPQIIKGGSDMIIPKIEPVSNSAKSAAQAKWDSIAKPIGSLGLLEEIIVRMAGAYGSADIAPLKKALVIMCADNGIVTEGVAQTDREVTAIMTETMGNMQSTVCVMSAFAGCDVYPVNIGVARPVRGNRIVQKCVRQGTRNFAEEPAMTLSECEQAIAVGIDMVRDLAAQGYNLIATGEMGIGNTTTSSAVAAVLLGLPAEAVTGRGAGLSDEGLSRKVSVIQTAINKYSLLSAEPLKTLAAVGGLDIAGLTGVFIGCAKNRIPVLVDGFISSVAALVATRLEPNVRDYLIGSHVSNEYAAKIILDELGLSAPIHAEMRLGEGTGAVAVIPLIETALAAYQKTVTFSDISIEDMV